MDIWSDDYEPPKSSLRPWVLAAVIATLLVVGFIVFGFVSSAGAAGGCGGG